MGIILRHRESLEKQFQDSKEPMSVIKEIPKTKSCRAKDSSNQIDLLPNNQIYYQTKSITQAIKPN